jgi:hypothetical protein
MKLIATALPAALLAAGLAAPSVASAAEPAPTNIRISWKDSSLTYVHLTWDEATPQPNVLFHRVVGQDTRYRITHLAADAPNELDVPVSLLRRGTATLAKEIGVTAGTPEDEGTSPVALSAPFDTLGPAAVTLDSFTMSGTNGLKVKWSGGALAAADDTPGDPLDQTVPVRFQPRYQRVSDSGIVDVGGPIAAKELSFTGPAERATFFVSATNEWATAASGAQVAVYPSDVKASIPTWLDANSAARISGTVAYVVPTRPAALQARDSSTGPWYTVGTTQTTGEIYFDLNPYQGTRQFRLYAANQATKDAAYFGGYSAVGTMTVQQHISAFPLTEQIKVGQTNTIYVNLGPDRSATTTFQQWNGKTWVTLGTLALNASGHGEGKLRATTVGRAVYRYYVPAGTWRNLPVAAAYSNQFAITTTR